MADYKVHLGVKLNTGDINDQISKYKAKPIDVKAKLNLDNVKTQLQNYRGQIEVQTKLNTTGLAKKIGEYKPKTPIILNAKLATSDIDTALRGYKAKPIEVGVSVRTSDIKEQLKNYKSTEAIEVDAKLDKTKIDNAIRNYQPKTRIGVRLTLSAADVEEELKKYTPSQPLKVKLKIDRADVNAQLKQYKADHEDAFIKVKAKLDNGAITQAIKDYKAITPIKLAVTVDDSEIEKKINAYRAKAPIDLSVSLKANTQDVATQLKKHKLTVPVELLVGDLDITGIDKKLSSYKAKTPIQVGVKLNDGDINTQIKAYKINTPIKIAAQLDTSSIDNQIRSYIPTTPIKVAVQLDNSEISEDIRKVGLGKSINVTLDREKINEQIKNLTIKSKAKVGIKLDFVGIPKQISDYQTKSKFKVGVKLDKDDIAQQIATINIDKPIKLGVELDPEGINNVKGQVNEIKRQIEALGNIRINLGGSSVSSGSSVNSTSTSTDTNAKTAGAKITRDLIEADVKIRTTKENVEALQEQLRKIGFEEDAIKTVTTGIDNLDIAVKRVTTRLYKDGTMTLTINGVDEAKRAVTAIYDVVGKNDVTPLSQKITQNLGESERFIRQQKRAVADLTNQINQVNRAAIDPNAHRPIKDTAHLDSLKSKYTEIILAIEAMGNASSNTFEDERNKVKALIGEYKSLKSEYKNAENVSDFDGSDFDSKLKQAQNSLAAFKREAEKFPQMTQTVKELEDAFAKVGDAGSLRTFTNQLDVADSALKNIKAEANEAYKALADAQNKIANLSTQIARLNPEANPRQLAELSAQLEEAENDYKSLQKAFSSKLSTSQFGTLQANADDLTKALKVIEEKHRDTRAELARKISIHLEAGKFTTQVERINSGINGLSNTSQELEAKLTALKNAKQVMDTAFASGSIDEQITSYRQYLRVLEDVENQLKQNQIHERDAVNAQKLEFSKQGLSSDMTSWLRENSVAAKRFGDEVKRLQVQLETCDNSVDFNNIKSEFRNVQKEAKALGLTGLTTFDKLKYKFKEYMAYFSVAEVFMWAEQGLRSMFEQVKLIDSAMTELKKVTDETNASYDKFLKNAALRSKEIGTTIDGLVSSTADFARLGYGFEDAQGLAEVANIYAVVGDEIEGVEGATKSLISTMAAFQDEMNGMSKTDFAMSIIDKFNEIGNNFAISSGGIGEALERSASSLMAANNTIDESIALITAANTVVQNPDAVGTAFKTISMRIKIHCPQ